MIKRGLLLHLRDLLIELGEASRSRLRKLVDESKRARVLGAEEPSEMSGTANVRQNGTGLKTSSPRSRRRNS